MSRIRHPKIAAAALAALTIVHYQKSYTIKDYSPSKILMKFFILLSAFQYATVVLALVKGLDVSQVESTSIWTCVQKQGFAKAIPRLYQEACGLGGRIDPNFIKSYNNIRASGIDDIDAYFFPCTGSTHNCKSPQQQVDEIVQYVNKNKLKLHRLWFDLEPPSKGSPCKGWDYGKTQNAVLAKKFIAAIKGTKWKWGVYANPVQWPEMFESKNVDIASDLPLWLAKWDKVAKLPKDGNFMGGWTSVFAKQYQQSTGGCAPAGTFDLNVFTD